MSNTKADAGHSGRRDPRRAAKSFYGVLNDEGFTPEQVIALANSLLGHVADDIVDDLPVIATK